MRLAAQIELMLCWLAWAYPFAFRAPHIQRRSSTVATGPTVIGLALETAAVLVAAVVPASARTIRRLLAHARVHGDRAPGRHSAPGPR